MNKYFNISDVAKTDEKPTATSGILAEKFLNYHCLKIESLKQLTGKLPGPEDLYFLWTINSFNAFTVIPFLLKECGQIKELVLSTYSINIRIIDALTRLMDQKKIGSVEIFISDSIKARQPKVNDHLGAITINYPVKVIYAWNHSKVTLIHALDHHFIFEGSGNFSENAQHEQYIFLDNQRVYSFRKNEILNGLNR